MSETEPMTGDTKQPKREQLRLRYVAIETLKLWDRNPKHHSLEKLADSIRQHGFKDPVKVEPALNDGRGGIVEGNGRVQTLLQMMANGEEPPRGIGLDEEGRWHVPVLIGIDGRSRAEAEAYGLDHNSLTVLGGDLELHDVLRMYDESSLVDILEGMPDAGALLASFEADDIASLLTGPDFEPVAAEEQSRLDKRKPVTCPECGAEFQP